MTEALRSVLLDVAGVAVVRVVDATERELGICERQLGATRHPGSAAAIDITVRLVDRLPTTPSLHVGVGDCSFDETTFYVHTQRGGAHVRTAFPVDRLGKGIELVCERPLRGIPHLVALVNLVVLPRHVLPLHASAFTDGDRSFLVTGWSKSGKTEALVGAMAVQPGLRYVGDEWVYLLPDGWIRGLREPIRLWDWHLRQLPQLLSRCTPAQRRRLTALRAAVYGSRSASSVLSSRAESLHKFTAALGRQLSVQCPPEDLFGAGRVDSAAKLDQVVLLFAAADQEWSRRAAERGEVATRMRASLLEERARFMSHYRQFRYAFPDRSSRLVETAPSMELHLLEDRLGEPPAVVIRHPYPCDITRLGSFVLEANATERRPRASRAGIAP